MTSLVFDQTSWLMLNDDRVYSSGRSLRVISSGSKFQTSDLEINFRRVGKVQEHLGTVYARLKYVLFRNLPCRLPLTVQRKYL